MNCIRTMIISAVVGALLCGCSMNPIERGFVDPMQKAHGIDTWQQKKALSFDLTVRFGGNLMIEGTFAFELHGPRAKMQVSEEMICYYDGEDAWITNASDDVAMARFSVLTWPWFVYAPMVLKGDEVHVTDLMDRPFKDGVAPSVRITLDPGAGDTPDDWYIFYQDEESKLLAGQAYIVTFGKSVEKANEEPHAITYDQFVSVDGVMIPTLWHFWNWSESDGVHGEQIGDATVTNLRFFEPTAETFAVPPDARKIPLPEAR